MLPSFTRVTLRVLALLGQGTWTKTVCFRGGVGDWVYLGVWGGGGGGGVVVQQHDSCLFENSILEPSALRMQSDIWTSTDKTGQQWLTGLLSACEPTGTCTPRVTFRRVVVPLQGPGQSPVLPSACCVGSLRSVGRCGRCSCWCRFRIR